MSKEEKERVERVFEALDDRCVGTCPMEDVAERKYPPDFCNEEFCLNCGGAECWKRYIFGEFEK